jgi:hypothetical protein
LIEQVDLCGVWGEGEGLAGSGMDALAEHGREVLAGEPMKVATNRFAGLS